MTVALAPGGAIPLLGFGTWQLAGDDAYNGVRAALGVGYRHVDAATGYANDRVGTALRDSGLDRGEVFVTTKCPPERAGRELETLEESLAALGLDFVDLWLVHWPPNGEARPETWNRAPMGTPVAVWFLEHHQPNEPAKHDPVPDTSFSRRPQHAAVARQAPSCCPIVAHVLYSSGLPGPPEAWGDQYDL